MKKITKCEVANIEQLYEALELFWYHDYQVIVEHENTEYDVTNRKEYFKLIQKFYHTGQQVIVNGRIDTIESFIQEDDEENYNDGYDVVLKWEGTQSVCCIRPAK